MPNLSFQLKWKNLKELKKRDNAKKDIISLFPCLRFLKQFCEVTVYRYPQGLVRRKVKFSFLFIFVVLLAQRAKSLETNLFPIKFFHNNVIPFFDNFFNQHNFFTSTYKKRIFKLYHTYIFMSNSHYNSNWELYNSA